MNPWALGLIISVIVVLFLAVTAVAIINYKAFQIKKQVQEGTYVSKKQKKEAKAAGKSVEDIKIQTSTNIQFETEEQKQAYLNELREIEESLKK